MIIQVKKQEVFFILPNITQLRKLQSLDLNSYLPDTNLHSFVVVVFFFFFSFRAAFVAYGVSQARGLIGAVAANLHYNHSNTGFKPRLQPTPQLTAMLDP